MYKIVYSVFYFLPGVTGGGENRFGAKRNKSWICLTHYRKYKSGGQQRD